MKLVKDLLYDRGNQSLDIARLSALGSMVAFWTGVFILLWQRGGFDPVAVGTGCAALMAGSAGWIFARQKHEAKKAEEPVKEGEE